MGAGKGKREGLKWREETYGHDGGYVHYFDCGDGCMHMSKLLKLFFQCVQFIICLLYLNKAVEFFKLRFVYCILRIFFPGPIFYVKIITIVMLN